MRFFIIVMTLAFFTTPVFAESITLKSGRIIEGKIIEKTADYIKLDYHGIELTFYNDELDFQEDISERKESKQTLPPTISFDNIREFYKKTEKYTNISEDETRLIDTAFKNKQRYLDENLKNIVSRNAEALEFFRKAANGNTDGYSFGLEPELYDITLLTKIHHNLTLLKLDILRAENADEKIEINNAYLGLVGFLSQIAQLRFPALFSMIYSQIILNIFEDHLIEFIAKTQDADLLQAMSQRLKEALERAVSFEEIIEQEKKSKINDLKSMETELKKQMNKKNISHAQSQDFIENMIKNFDSLANIATNKLISAASINKEAEYMTFMKEFTDKLRREVEGFGPQKIKNYDQQTSDLMAKMLFVLSYGQLGDGKLIAPYYTQKIRIQNISIAIALKQYWFDNGHIPQNLSALIPKYLEKLTDDSFNEFLEIKYIRQSDNKAILYSVGPDGKDQKGKKIFFEEARTIGDIVNLEGDIVINLEFKPIINAEKN